MAQADDIYRRLCREGQADRLRSLQDRLELEPRRTARNRMLLSHLSDHLAGGAQR